MGDSFTLNMAYVCSLYSYSFWERTLRHYKKSDNIPLFTDTQGWWVYVPPNKSIIILCVIDDNRVFQDGMTALVWAAYQGDQQIVLILLNAGANPDIQDQVADCVCVYD